MAFPEIPPLPSKAHYMRAVRRMSGNFLYSVYEPAVIGTAVVNLHRANPVETDDVLHTAGAVANYLVPRDPVGGHPPENALAIAMSSHMGFITGVLVVEDAHRSFLTHQAIAEEASLVSIDNEPDEIAFHNSLRRALLEKGIAGWSLVAAENERAIKRWEQAMARDDDPAILHDYYATSFGLTVMGGVQRHLQAVEAVESIMNPQLGDTL